MAKVHVLGMTSHGHFNCLVHFNAPAGSNSASVTWKAAAIAAGTIGNAAHPQADAGEVADIAAGNIVELQVVLAVDPEGRTAQEITDMVDDRADAEIAKWTTDQQAALNYWGYSQGVVS
jgi:hypothetical protein